MNWRILLIIGVVAAVLIGLKRSGLVSVRTAR